MERIHEEQEVYLKDNVVLEPLIDKWYVWPHLISPVTYAFNLKFRNIPILESFIKNPELHAAAVKDPKMIGGPFMDYDVTRTGEVQEYLDQLIARNEKLLELSNMFLELNKLLLEHGQGGSLEPLYNEIPDGIKGCVELFYDLNNNPSYRLYEHLIYHSEYYDPSAQGFKVYEINGDERNFVLSSPRLDTDGFYLDLPFNDERVDLLYRTSREGHKFSDLVQLLGLDAAKAEKFKSYFTTVKPERAYKDVTEDSIRIRYFGHACILLEINGLTILLDPVISYDYDSKIARFTYADLPETIDYVLITHNHQDHILLETMLKLRHKVKNIVIPRSTGYLQDPSLKHALTVLGFKNIIEFDEFSEIQASDLSIVGLPFLGEHSDLNIRCKLCYHLTLGGHKILFAADTKNLSPEMYERVVAIYGQIDMLFLGMECDGAPLSWLYGPLMPQKLPRKQDYSRTLSGSNYQEALAMVGTFKPKHVYVYAMGQEPWLEYIMAIKYTEESDPIVASNRLLEYCQANGIVAERLFGEKEIKLEA